MSKIMNRRSFARTCAAFAASMLALPSSVISAADLPDLDPADPQASALGYTADATQVDTAKFANYVVGSSCANCQLYQGGDAAGGCAIFPGKQVSASGWCSVWAKKPA